MTQAKRNASISLKLKAYTELHTRSKRAANKALIREGFVLKNGKPAPAFADDDRELVHS